jgi:TPR repeat protein
MYEKHEVTQINGELEDKYLEMAVLGNLPEALYLSAKKTLEKTNAPSDETKSNAIRKLNFAADKGNLDAKYYLATLNSSGNEHTTIKLLTEAAEKGHYNSQYKLGKIYFEQSPALNCKKSITWFLKSMDTAKFKAAQIIADRYDLDIKVIDEAALKQAYRKIALKTHPDKISSYKNPGKLKEDYEKITKLYKEGYNSKVISSILNDKLHDDVEYSIGQMYHKGCVDLDINLSTAKEWYDKGSKNDHSDSHYEAYVLHNKGISAKNVKDDSGIDSSDSNIFADQSSNAIDEALGEVNNQDEL